MSNVVCSCCSTDVERHLAILCGICKKPFKGACVGLTSSEVRKINEKKRGLTWSCTNCCALGQDINDLKAVILNLQSELRELKSNSQSCASEHDFELFMQEFEERQARKSNIIIFGAPEQDSRLATASRLNNEKTEVSNLLTKIHPNLTLPTEVKVSRLGKFIATNERPRPMRVNLGAEKLVHEIIRNFISAKSTDGQLRHLSISFDRTPRQLDYLKKTKSELRRRQDNGETNLKIKFHRGIPSIVPLN